MGRSRSTGSLAPSAGPVEKGTRWQQTLRLFGEKLETSDEAIEVEEPRRLVVRSAEAQNV